MKTDFAKLSDAYRYSLIEKAKTSAESCPSAEDIMRWLRSELSKKERKAMIEHATHCPECLRIAKSFLSINKLEDRFIKDVNAVWQSDEQSVARKPMFRWKSIYSKWAVGLGFGAALLVVIYCFALRNARGPSERGEEEKNVQISMPSRVKISRGEIIFVWSQNPDDAQYVVEIYDKSFGLKWRSDSLKLANIGPPTDVVQSLKSNESYFVMVRAIKKDGKEVSSKLKEFILIN